MKKVLVVSYFWPPVAKASMHWQFYMVKYLPALGYEPIVLTVKESDLEPKDPSLLAEMDPNLKIIKTDTLEPFEFYQKFTGKGKNNVSAGEAMSKVNAGIRQKLALWVRTNFFIPDARIGWVTKAVPQGLKELEGIKLDAVTSVGPPHTCHLVAKKISEKLNLPYIAVLEDPWSDIVYYDHLNRSFIAAAIDKHLEKKTLRYSDGIVFVNNTTRDDYISKYNFVKEKSNVLYWGYNEHSFDGISRTRKEDGKTLIVHTGNIYDYQNPPNFWKTLKEMKDEGKNIELRFTGNVSPLIKEELKNNGLLEITVFLGYIAYKEMLQELVNADVLLMSPYERRHVPGKLFEYLRTGVPILAFNDENFEVKQLIEDANAGIMLKRDDSGKKFFAKLSTFRPDKNYVKKFDRKMIAEEFSKIINDLTK